VQHLESLEGFLTIPLHGGLATAAANYTQAIAFRLADRPDGPEAGDRGLYLTDLVG